MATAAQTKWEQLKAQDPTKKHDFQVRIHVIEARDLKPRDSNGMSDPVCVVNVIDQKMSTKKYSNTTICTFDHLMFFEYNLIADEFFLGKIKVSVFDANTILRNVLIGTYEFDIGAIYNMDNHELYRRWVALSDTTGKNQGVQGYVKLSVTVLGPNDKAPAHEEEEEQDDEQDGADLQSMVLLPPSIATEEHALEISVFRAEALPKMDTMGKCDGFVTVKYGGNDEIKTEIVKNTFTPTWMERLLIPVTTPTLTDLIKVQVKDWDAVGKDDIVATFFMKWSEISGGIVNWKQPRWVNLYGTPEGVEIDAVTRRGKLASKMLNGFVDGCYFRGRVLMAATSNKIANQKLSKHKINPAAEPPVSNYTLRFDLYEAAEIKSKAKLSIEVAIGSSRYDSKKVSIENGNASFYQSFDDITLALPSDRDQIPDIFLDVIKVGTGPLAKRKRIGYIRIKASELSVNTLPKWELIQPDIFTQDEEDQQQITGFLQYRLAFGLESEMPKSRDQLVKPKLKKYQLRAHIYQGRDLPAADANGLSDPYVIVRVGRFSAKTKILKKTLYPLWYETLPISVELPENLSQASDINVSVFDWDQLDGDDFLGRFSIPLTKINDQQPQVPTWFPIYAKNPKAPEGEILASFQLIPEDRVSSIPITDITPKYKDCTVEVSVIGIRNMLPFRLLPVSKAYVEVDCGGDVVLKTKIAENGNFLEVLPLQVKLPASRIYSPPLNIRVYDDRLIYKPLVAARAISLASYIPWEDPLPIAEVASVDDEQRVIIVDKIPGASGKEEIAPAQVDVKIVPLEEDIVDVSNENEKKMKDIQDKLTGFIDTSAPSKVAESYINGAESEMEEKKEERSIVKNELEATMAPTFHVFPLYRTRKQQGRRVKVEVGTFKGGVRVYEKGAKVDPPIDLKALYAPAEYVVRAYVLEGFQLVPKDSDGSNNPYVRIKCGKNKINDVKEVKQATSRPQFFKCYELPISFPQHNSLEIGVWDYDRIGSDDLIGATTIDIENRVFSPEWKDRKIKPIEYRTLWNPCSSNPQGQIKLWVDILTPAEAQRSPPENIAPPLPVQYEMRVIIWETKDVVFKDKNMSDIFVVGYPEGPGVKPQTTDTHWRSENGEGKFNYRFKFPVVMPCPTPRFKVQVWDKDILNPNDAIAEANLNLKSFYNRAYKNKSDRESLEQQWVAMTHPSAQGVQGQVLISFELLSLEEAKRRPAGYGRKEPNDNPHLDEPVRPETSFNPLRLDKMISKVVWGQNKGKIIAGVTCICVVIILIIILVTMAQLRAFT